MLSPDIAAQLRSRGHDVQAVAENRTHPALSDEEVMDRAREEQRAVVTNNVRDFRRLHASAILPGGSGHHGMVFIPGQYRRTKADTGRIIAALEAKLAEYPGDADLASAETWL